MATRAQARYEITAVDRTKRAFRRINRSLGAMKEQAKKTTAAIGAVSAVGAAGLVAFTRGALKSAEAIQLLSNQTGQSVQSIQRVQKVLERIGKGDQAADVIRDVAEAIGEAKREPGGAKGMALGRLGINAQALRSVEDFFAKVSKAFARSQDKTRTLFDLREISDSAGDALAAIGGDFELLRRKTKGTLFDPATASAAMQTMRQFRTLFDEIRISLQAGLLNSGALKAFQAAMTRISEVLGTQGIKGALAEVANILIDTFPRATELVFDAFVRIREVVREVQAQFKSIQNFIKPAMEALEGAKILRDRAFALPDTAAGAISGVASEATGTIVRFLGEISRNTKNPGAPAQ